jgi:hypothetical protein
VTAFTFGGFSTAEEISVGLKEDKLSAAAAMVERVEVAVAAARALSFSFS